MFMVYGLRFNTHMHTSPGERAGNTTCLEWGAETVEFKFYVFVVFAKNQQVSVVFSKNQLVFSKNQLVFSKNHEYVEQGWEYSEPGIQERTAREYKSEPGIQERTAREYKSEPGIQHASSEELKP